MGRKLSSIPHTKIKYLGVDTGGTFTDFVLFDGERWAIHKVLSTPDNPAQAILQGIDDLGLKEALDKQSLTIIHGSTVATNAVLENKGAKTIYIANKGFKDLLTIGRQARDELYTLKPGKQPAPVPEALCLEIDTRRDASGQLITPLTHEKLEALRQAVQQHQPEAIAINLLFSFLDDAEERQLEALFQNDYFTSRSSFVLPKYKEYERGMATWLNASLGPRVQRYMARLKSGVNGCPVSVMQSSGGTLAIDQAAIRAVNLLLSGPAGGLAAVKSIGEQCGIHKIISFDMGGTSTDVALMDGDFSITEEGRIGPWPVAIPMLNIETIGAGGGSIAWVDPGGMLHVGPESAGSAPGPACYGAGGTDPCVTDANVFLGRLLPDAFLGGKMQLDKAQSVKAITQLAAQLNLDATETALGIVKLAEHEMIRAIHRISIKKGHNPGEFVLCCFGGAGGLHVCSLAEQLNMKTALVPQNSGVLSALGMLVAPIKRQLTRTFLETWHSLDKHKLEEAFTALENEAMGSLLEEHMDPAKVKVRHDLDMRYAGQSYTLPIERNQHAEQHFIQRHKDRFGHTLNHPVELVNISVTLEVPSTLAMGEYESAGKTAAQPTGTTRLTGHTTPVPVYKRAHLNPGAIIKGPALITEPVSTTWLKPDWEAQLDTYGNLKLIQK